MSPLVVTFITFFVGIVVYGMGWAAGALRTVYWTVS